MNGADRPETGPQPLALGMPGSPGAGGNGAQEGDGGGNPSAPASLSLPKGGGTIQGMGEKFAANPVTGRGSMTVPSHEITDDWYLTRDWRDRVLTSTLGVNVLLLTLCRIAKNVAKDWKN